MSFRGALPKSRRACATCKTRTTFIYNEKTGHSECKYCHNWTTTKQKHYLKGNIVRL